MLINFSTAISDLQLKIKGVIQVGAHYGQEYKEYISNGIEDCIFIEPCHSAYGVLEKLNTNKHVLLFNCACGDQDGPGYMHVSADNQGMSNSLLKPKLHVELYPHIRFTDTEVVPVRRLDNLPFNRSKYNLLVMDTQGTELSVLKGATETLPSIDYIYTEVNKGEMYEGNTLVTELDQYLEDFQRVDTFWVQNMPWGDAIYVRRTLLKSVEDIC